MHPRGIPRGEVRFWCGVAPRAVPPGERVVRRGIRNFARHSGSSTGVESNCAARSSLDWAVRASCFKAVNVTGEGQDRPMKVLVIVARPNGAGFNHAIAQTCAKALTDNGRAGCVNGKLLNVKT